MTLRPLLAAGLVAVLAVAGCGGDDDGGGDEATSASSETTEGTPTTRAEATDVPPDLSVLVTNDDGVGAPGIDALVEALRALPGIEVSVVAPADESSGTGGRVTEGPLTTTDVTTASGYEATAVDGYPADTIRAGLDDLGVEPDLVMSGINSVQNLGLLTDVSGTVGGARAAAERGIPALAVSAGMGSPPDYATAAAQALSWLEENRSALAAGEAEVVVTNLNVPTCPDGSVRELVEVPVATDPGDEVLPADQVQCASSLTDPADDVEGFNNGYVTLSELDAA